MSKKPKPTNRKAVTELSPAVRDLKLLRERAKLSIRGFAQAIGENWSTYSSFERRYKRAYLPMELVEKMRPVLVARGIPDAEILRLAGPEGIVAGAANRVVAKILDAEREMRLNPDKGRLYELEPDIQDAGLVRKVNALK